MALYDAHEMPIAWPAQPLVASRYAGRAGPNWSALAGIIALHAIAVAALGAAGVIEVKRVPAELKVIQLSAEATPPPPVVKPRPPVQVELRAAPNPVAPLVPQVQASTPPVPVAAANPVVAEPAPLPPPPAPPAPATPAGPVSVSDLDASAVTIVPPKYPLESRRKREQGIVVLSVLLGTDGAVESVSVARSSGHERLDKAALDAVRRWRWSPTVRGGQAVAVRGTVDIPFVLQG